MRVLFSLWYFFLVDISIIWGSYPPLYGEPFSHFGRFRFHLFLFFNRVELMSQKLKNCPRILNSQPSPTEKWRWYIISAIQILQRQTDTRTIPLSLRNPRFTRSALFSHEFCVIIENLRLGRGCASFFSATTLLWSLLLSSAFPAELQFLSF